MDIAYNAWQVVIICIVCLVEALGSMVVVEIMMMMMMMMHFATSPSHNSKRYMAIAVQSADRHAYRKAWLGVPQ